MLANLFIGSVLICLLVENVFAQHWHMYPGAAPTNDANYVVRSNFDGANVLVVPLEYNEIEDIQYVNGYYGDKGGQKIALSWGRTVQELINSMRVRRNPTLFIPCSVAVLAPRHIRAPLMSIPM